MTDIIVGDITPIIRHVADGVLVAFDYPFPILAAADLEVSLDGVVQTTGYSVAGAGLDDGGTVTFTAPPADEAIVTLRRAVTVERVTNFAQSGSFLASAINTELNRLVMIAQEHAGQLDRVPRTGLSDTTPSGSLEIPSVADRAGKYLAFDTAGAVTASAGPHGDTGLPTSPLGEALFAAASEAAARLLIGAAAAAACAVDTLAVAGNATVSGDLTVDDITCDDITCDDITCDDVSADDIDAASYSRAGTSLPVQRSTTYAEAAIAGGGQIVIAHGLAAAPPRQRVFLRLKCIDPDGEHGYAQNDLADSLTVYTGSVTCGVVVTAIDATNITLRVGNISPGTLHKTTGSPVACTPAKWNLIVTVDHP